MGSVEMTAGNTPRRAKLAAVATGVVALGVLVTPALAGAEEHGHGAPTTAAPTTAAPTTAAPTTAAPTTKPPTTAAPTTKAPTPPQVVPVHAPGEIISVSGGGCLIDGKPGWIAYGIADNYGHVVGGLGSQAKADGSWSLSVAVPADAQNGEGYLGVGCFDLLSDHSVLEYPFIIEGGKITGTPGGETRDAKAAAEAKVAAPKPVKANAKYTG
jgi:hypothetical protein